MSETRTLREQESINIKKSLKPCPFCGGRPFMESAARAYIDGKSTKVAFVRCQKCNARGGRVDISDFGKSSRSIDAEREAAANWNRRKEA